MLETILQELLNQVKAGPEPTAQKVLGGGMGIHLRKDGGSVVLTVWRERVPPSTQEWNIVIAHWPWQLGALNWSNSGVTAKGKYIKQVRISI